MSGRPAFHETDAPIQNVSVIGRGSQACRGIGQMDRDAAYLDIIVRCVRACAEYRPKFGLGSRKGLTLEDFQQLYQKDPFYIWLGLDNPLLYTAHKAAGGMTSVYRQIGIACERLFREILKDSFGLSDDDVAWSYETPLANGGTRRLALDGRVSLDSVKNADAKARFHDWMRQCAYAAEVESRVFNSLTGAVFEVRQGYKSKDSKRQNADIANAAAAYVKSYLPCIAVFSNQIDVDILMRYKAAKWTVLTGVTGQNNPLISIYDFMRSAVGYDLEAFFERHSDSLRSEIDLVLETLLGTGFS